MVHVFRRDDDTVYLTEQVVLSQDGHFELGSDTLRSLGVAIRNAHELHLGELLEAVGITVGVHVRKADYTNLGRHNRHPPLA